MCHSGVGVMSVGDFCPFLLPVGSRGPRSLTQKSPRALSTWPEQPCRKKQLANQENMRRLQPAEKRKTEGKVTWSIPRRKGHINEERRSHHYCGLQQLVTQTTKPKENYQSHQKIKLLLKNRTKLTCLKMEVLVYNCLLHWLLSCVYFFMFYDSAWFYGIDMLEAKYLIAGV